MVCYLKESCCGCSLTTGTSIIAYLGILGSIGGIIQAIFGLASPNSSYSNGDVVNGVSLGISIIQLIFCLLLLYAVSVKQRRSKLVIAWLVETAIVTGAGIISCIILFVFGAFIEASILLLAFGLNAYFWWVVFSFHHELKLAEEIRNGKGTESTNLNDNTIS